MPLVDVLGDVARDRPATRLEGAGKSLSHGGGDPVAHVQELAHVHVVGRVRPIVSHRRCHLLARPGAELDGQGQTGGIDVDDTGVRRAELCTPLEGGLVDVSHELEAVAAGLGQTDHLFEPGRARGLYVHAGARGLQRVAHGGKDGELVAARVDAELEAPGQPEGFHGIPENGDVFGELALELRDVADIVDALVEPAAETRRDGLHGDPRVGDGGQDQQQLSGRLRPDGLVHRDFGDESRLAACLKDATVDAGGLADGVQIGGRRALGHLPGDNERAGYAGNVDPADEVGVAVEELLDDAGPGGLADRTRHVEREEVRRGDEALDRLECDVIGIDEVRRPPGERANGPIGSRAHVDRLRADGFVLAVGLVPHRNDVHPALGRERKGLKLRLGFVGEPVAHPE